MRIPYARQGDLMIFKIDGLPKNVKRKKNLTLALGEATGHHHTLVAEDQAGKINAYFDELAQKTYFEVQAGSARLVHQEHKTQTQIFEPGVYEVEVEEGYDYTTETLQKVQD